MEFIQPKLNKILGIFTKLVMYVTVICIVNYDVEWYNFTITRVKKWMDQYIHRH